MADLQSFSVRCRQGGVQRLCSPVPARSSVSTQGWEPHVPPSTSAGLRGTGRGPGRGEGRGRGSGWGLEAAAGYSQGPFGWGQGGVPLCGSPELVPVSLARLLWLPDRWLGGRASCTLGDSVLPPARGHV